MRGMTFCFAAVLVSVRRGVSLDLSRIANTLEWQCGMLATAGHGDVDTDDDLEIVIALGILPLLLAAILPLVANLAPPQRLPRMGVFYDEAVLGK
ncbi:hypothetical protein V8C86DRAFT_2735893 [Haematococcus lacustris]